MSWEIKVKEPEKKGLPNWVYALPVIGVVLVAIAKRRRR